MDQQQRQEYLVRATQQVRTMALNTRQEALQRLSQLDANLFVQAIFQTSAVPAQLQANPTFFGVSPVQSTMDSLVILLSHGQEMQFNVSVGDI